MELLALKQSMGKADNKISVKEPVLIETKGDGDITVDAKYVKEEDEV